jgi:hypothetical protein
LGIAALVVMTGAALFFCRKPTLVIRDLDTDRIYWKRTIRRGDTFSIEFIHSVNQSPVRDTFIVQRDGIGVLEALFYDFGAGMQTDLQEGQTLERLGDALVIRGFRQTYRELHYIVGTVSDHVFIFRDSQISLRNLCGRNAHIVIQVKK